MAKSTPDTTPAAPALDQAAILGLVRAEIAQALAEKPAVDVDAIVKAAVGVECAELKRWMRKEIHLAACAATLEEREKMNP